MIFTSSKRKPKPNDILNPDCPCPNTTCKNHGNCTACRRKHTKSKPYCERDTVNTDDNQA